MNSGTWKMLATLVGLGAAEFVLAQSPAPAVQVATTDVLIADFEGDTYAPWTVTGEAFGPGPATGTLPNQMHVDGFQGRGLVNSFFKGDESTGTLTSPEFRIERKFVAFLIGGGQHDDKLAFQLLVDGKVVRTAAGPNDRAGGSETLARESWDVAELVGKTAVLRIVDDARGGWGHINVDHIVQTDRKPPGWVSNAERQFPASARYLHIPIRNGAPKRVVTLLVDGRPVVRNDIELADGQPDWWAPMDVGQWRGKSLTLRVDKLSEESTALSSVLQSDSLQDAGALYREPLRGQFHFSPRRGWNNDPNGLAFYQGEYHLFFQHNPYGWGWGNMHWGHAVSRDLVHWVELGDTLLPDDMGPMFSGSAVVDWKNTSGFGKDGKPPLVLIYTAAGNPTVQGIAYSTDGRHFTKYSGNPVLQQITAGNRDPKVMWHEPTQKWVMVLYVEWQKKHTTHFFTSPNLRDWTLASITEGDAPGKPYLFECPDFFALPVDGDVTNQKWVLMAANSAYAIGTFDGTHFTPEQSNLPGHRGQGFYAAQTFSDIPATDGRRIQIGWFQTETKGMPFNQSMTVPLELNLLTTAEGPRLTFTPVKELEALRAKTHRFEAMTHQPGGANPLADVRAELVEVRAEFEPGDATEIIFAVRGARISYDTRQQELVVNGHRAPAPLRNGQQRVTIFCDRTGLEVFASDGLCYVPMPFHPRPEDLGLAVETKGAAVKFAALSVHELKSAWKAAEPEKVADAPGRWSREQAQAWAAEQPWLVGCNYLPSTAINQLEMFQAETFDATRIDQELGYAERLGFTSVRVFLHDLLWKQDRDGFLQRCDTFLSIADKHGIRVMFVLFDSCWHPLPRLGKQPEPRPHTHNSGWVQSPGIEVLKDPDGHPHLREYVAGVVRRFADDKRVVVWDLWNEPDNFDGGAAARPGLEPRNKPQWVNALLPQVFAWAREANPSQPLTSGVWRDSDNITQLDDCKRIQLAHSDIVSFHSYGDPPSLERCLKNLAVYERPLLCTEFMARPNGSLFEPHLELMKNAGVAAYCWGFINGKSQTIYPWDSWTKSYTAPPPVWFHDILQPDGTPFRQSEVDYIRRVTR